ncbi:8-amino-7-oxononanoate synthase [Natronomonas pharaonis DSM 2160]|uniref:8-amino-7-oxononanoate synthase n=1 Tax=Natronomonas pharaonis (strain ATCC 35678 / DSM 2160 / CIP 103997 / JCM 8858 / NBRC 14720 / NCIMB 2260 / Gabara) TaxID=348780 RepID=A0A1U7EYB7_NATPD|nr:8-amino-7-oxononanoate synthase [Natronomonas pharaonis]CAI50207.1 8-amino-7-oxononanoate synthase [Natronomonas pharaonis DSM 2160]
MQRYDTRGFDLEARLADREDTGLRRDLAPVDSVGASARTAVDPKGEPPAFGDEKLVFAANNYLGLAGDDRLAAAAADTASAVGTGAGASRLVVGDTPAHRSLERRLAAEKSAERALVFSSGYAANVGTLTALSPDRIFSDELNHASIIDGARLSGADIEVYDHCDAAALEACMRDCADEAAADESWLVVTDSVFSMDGDVAPLADICDAADTYGAWVMVDEAHATGVYDGGIVGQRGLEDRVDVQLGTLSKALGAQGGFVAGDEPLVEYLLNAARSFVFSTGLAPPAAAAAERGLALAPQQRKPLWSNVDRLRSGLEALGYEVWGDTHILPVVVGDRGDALALADRLEDAGIVAPAIRPPTVPEGTSRIRLAPQATHTAADIDRCLAAFEVAGTEVGLL